ncbi:uncharacterized protein LOC122502171 [Leptopilina heterotoma]|uniref:uncharacterized protein LOC122502171 n=1 Tax=Leptopilina heterotoma TaxID=63436 RepID=UPI001CA832C2|nr:uncharacterized protein LOC122502171 [Leptopilina heterotoma]
MGCWDEYKYQQPGVIRRSGRPWEERPLDSDGPLSWCQEYIKLDPEGPIYWRGYWIPVQFCIPSIIGLNNVHRRVMKPGIESSLCDGSKLPHNVTGLDWQPVVKSLALVRVKTYTLTPNGLKIDSQWTMVKICFYFI